MVRHRLLVVLMDAFFPAAAILRRQVGIFPLITIVLRRETIRYIFPTEPVRCVTFVKA